MDDEQRSEDDRTGGTATADACDAPIDAEALVAAAGAAIDNAYAPYSHYPVGAAVLAEDGQVYTGSNIENAVYPLTICAERAAIATAVSSGARKILAVAVVTNNGGAPCGSCRQVMREFGEDDMPVYIADRTGTYRTRTLGALLPDSFSGQDLAEATPCPPDASG